MHGDPPPIKAGQDQGVGTKDGTSGDKTRGRVACMEGVVNGGGGERGVGGGVGVGGRGGGGGGKTAFPINYKKGVGGR